MCGAAVNCAVSFVLILHRTLASLAQLLACKPSAIPAHVQVHVYADDIVVWADQNTQPTTVQLIAWTHEDRVFGG